MLIEESKIKQFIGHTLYRPHFEGTQYMYMDEEQEYAIVFGYYDDILCCKLAYNCSLNQEDYDLDWQTPFVDDPHFDSEIFDCKKLSIDEIYQKINCICNIVTETY